MAAKKDVPPAVTYKAIEAELKDDPEIRPYIVPVPDYNMVTIILLKRILDKLTK